MAKWAGCFFAALLICGLAAAWSNPALAQAGPMAAPTSHIEVGSLPPPGVANFDPHKAVEAYLARVSGQARERSDSYFDGSIVLNFADTLYVLVVAALLLWLRISAKMRDYAVRITRFRFLQAPIYVAQYFVVTTLVTLPLTIYESFVREHAYGLSNQNFMQWAGDFGTEFLVDLVSYIVLLTIIYAVIRAAKAQLVDMGRGRHGRFPRRPDSDHAGLSAPLFNHYTPLPESGLKESILSMARANGIPADNIYMFDASKQSTPHLGQRLRHVGHHPHLA